MNPGDDTTCRQCGGAARSVLAVREMMLGTGDLFDYSECGACDAVQRVRADLDTSRYYPENYYAFTGGLHQGIGGMARRLRNWLALSPSSPFRGLSNAARPHPAADWLRRSAATRHTRILDVGCGRGTLLLQLHDAGFSSLTGVDPFLPATVVTPADVRMIRTHIDELTESGGFDLVMFHHSLEHIDDQASALAAAARLLAPGGVCLVRVPTVSSFAWRHYREHWYQLDAPRHTVLHSRASLQEVAARAGLVLEAVVDDSTAFQILLSERYRRGIPMFDQSDRPSRAEVREANARARRLNADGDGDQIAAYFRKPC